MVQLITSAEEAVRTFAAEFPTPNTREALRLCEAGRLPWAKVAALFQSSLRKAVDEVR